MIIKTMLFAIVAMVAIFLIGWGAVKLYFIWKDEADEDRQADRAVTRELRDAHEDLEAALSRKTKGK